jgi:hypothetical protein
MSARSFGNYDLARALADLIDNSIKASANTIGLNCFFNNGETEIRIIDDGHGMLPDELYAAMRPASQNPLMERAPDDLGRFGWGMKSASFSQCSCLTVLSRKKNEMSGATWDLNDLDNWKMGILSEKEIQALCSPDLLSRDGTEVIWNKCDRLSEDGSLNQDQFNDLIVHARNILALIFHRYIAGEVRGKRLTIKLNGEPVPEYDPFHRKHDATQPLEVETLKIPGQPKIIIRPYILPHYSKLKITDLDKLAGDEGLLKNQGFYVYRNNRLIIYGTWFRLVKHGELSQLVRVSLDIPNTLDSMWKISIDKSDVQLPFALRNRLKQIVTGLKGRSARVYRSKGGQIHDKGKVSVWKRYAKAGEIRYEINRDHPLIAALFQGDSTGQYEKVESALRAIEQGFPVNAFGQDVSSESSYINQTEADPQRFRDFLAVALPGILADYKGNINAMIKAIKNAEMFSNNWAMVEDYLLKEGWISG